MQAASWLDFLIGPLYFGLIYFFASRYQKKRELDYPAYKWFVKGLMVKCIGAVALTLVYLLYYNAGDTINYFHSARCVARLLTTNPEAFFRILLGEHTWQVKTAFTPSTGYPLYWNDAHSFFIVRLCVPFVLLSFNTLFGTALLLTAFFYRGVWRLFLLFNHVFPNMEFRFALAILFMPSLVFWGSGILKDSVSLAAVGLFTAHFYALTVQKKYSFFNVFYFVIAVLLMVLIKPYLLIALLPGVIIWKSQEQLLRIKSDILRMIVRPMFYLGSIGLGFFLISIMDTALGDYSLDNVLEKAVVSNLDQKQAYYGGNSFDIGDFDASVSGVASKAHSAIFATLYRPMLFEAKNPFMLLSGLENTFILFLTAYLLVKFKVVGIFKHINRHPLLLFSLMFSVLFAFSVGIATSNFGTLVRVKIPCIPFFVASLLVLKSIYEQEKQDRINNGRA